MVVRLIPWKKSLEKIWLGKSRNLCNYVVGTSAKVCKKLHSSFRSYRITEKFTKHFMFGRDYLTSFIRAQAAIRSTSSVLLLTLSMTCYAYHRFLSVKWSETKTTWVFNRSCTRTCELISWEKVWLSIRKVWKNGNLVKRF